MRIPLSCRLVITRHRIEINVSSRENVVLIGEGRGFLHRGGLRRIGRGRDALADFRAVFLLGWVLMVHDEKCDPCRAKS